MEAFLAEFGLVKAGSGIVLDVMVTSMQELILADDCINWQVDA